VNILETKIASEARKHGIDKYILKEDQYLFTYEPANNKMILEVNAADLVVFHSPSIMVVSGATAKYINEISCSGGGENRTHKLLGGDFEVAYIDTATTWHFVKCKPPFVVASRGIVNFTVLLPTPIIGASGYILGVSIIPIS